MDKKLEALRKEYKNDVIRQINFIKSQGKGIHELADYIALITSTPLSDYLLPYRRHDLVVPRQILSAVLYNTKIIKCYKSIGMLTNIIPQDHTTIISAIKQVKNNCDTHHHEGEWYNLAHGYYEENYLLSTEAVSKYLDLVKTNNPFKYAMVKIKQVEIASSQIIKMEMFSDSTGTLYNGEDVLFEFNSLEDLCDELDKIAPKRNIIKINHTKNKCA